MSQAPCHARALRALLVATLLASSTGHAQGADAWEALGPARIGATYDEVSQLAPLKCSVEAAQRICTMPTPAARIFAGVPVARVEAVFDQVRLQYVKVALDIRRYEDLLRMLTVRYGAGEDRSFVAIAGMAADFVAGVFVWRTESAILVLEQYAGKIDRSALTYGTESAMADLVRKTNAYPRGARRDL
jgi:hypothetical protein